MRTFPRWLRSSHKPGTKLTGSVPVLRLPQPGLRPPDQRDPDESPEYQLLPTLDQAHLALINRAGIGIEDIASAPLVADLLHPAHDDHAENGFVFALVRALIANVGRFLGVDGSFDPGK